MTKTLNYFSPLRYYVHLLATDYVTIRVLTSTMLHTFTTEMDASFTTETDGPFTTEKDGLPPPSVHADAQRFLALVIEWLLVKSSI